MILKTILDEDFTNYKLPSMFLAFPRCTWKCPLEGGFDVEICQNHPIAQMPDIEISIEAIYKRYINNPITSAIVCGGLEPLESFWELLDLINYFRSHNCNDTFVIYTGFNKTEIQTEISHLKGFKNIIIKYGRYVPNNQPHYDPILGVNLISDNQYAEQIS